MTTKHDCGGPIFGHKTPGCPRCDELLAGAAPIRWRKNEDAMRVDEVRSHFRSERHLSGECGPVCTFGD